MPGRVVVGEAREQPRTEDGQQRQRPTRHGPAGAPLGRRGARPHACPRVRGRGRTVQHATRRNDGYGGEEDPRAVSRARTCGCSRPQRVVGHTFVDPGQDLAGVRHRQPGQHLGHSLRRAARAPARRASQLGRVRPRRDQWTCGERHLLHQPRLPGSAQHAAQGATRG